MNTEPDTSAEPLPAPWDRPQEIADQLRAEGADEQTAVASGWQWAITAQQVGR